MAIRREWLDWNQPCLPQAVKWLLDRAASQPAASVDPNFIDLSHFTCVLPAARAGRVLLGLLMQAAGDRGAQILPPWVMTPGGLLNDLVQDQPIASEVEAVLAWMHALQHADDDAIAPLLPHRPEKDDVPSWHALASAIHQLHADLSGSQVTFARVADLAERREMFGEANRWRTMEQVQASYRRVLREHGLLDPHETRARAVECGPDSEADSGPLILIGVTELNAMQRRAIAIMNEVFALVHAPAHMAERFDECGCVRVEAWQDTTVDLNEEQLITTDRPGDQASHVLQDIGECSDDCSAEQVIIGLGDPALAPALEHAAEHRGLTVRSASGTPLQHTPQGMALIAIADYLDDPRFAAFASLVRHADIEEWLTRDAAHQHRDIREWITLLDEYFSSHLHERFTGEWLGNESLANRLKAVHDSMLRLLSPLLTPSHVRRRMADWAQPILDVLANLYEHDSSQHEPHHQRSVEACVKFRDVLADLGAAPASLQPRLSAGGAIRLVLQHADGESLPQRVESNHVEMLGWLELHLDVAPVLIIAGFNDGFVPGCASADAFLPDSLRAELGMPCNASRYARDAYLLQAILHSRERVRLIAGRRNQRGEPLTPSRLAFACDEQTLLNRMRAFSQAATDPRRIGVATHGTNSSRFLIPALPPLAAPARMRVTHFRSYLACPYRYALSALLKLEACADDAKEMDAMVFGVLAHEVLCDFGRDESVRDSANPAPIEACLHAALDRRAKLMFGRSPMPSVRVQLAHMALRLRAFATLQAAHRQEGWSILHCEHEFTDAALAMPDQEPMRLSGKIDRIDVHNDGRLLVLDYKMGEAGDSPHRTHHGGETIPDLADAAAKPIWNDLQLPLYHYLLKHSPLGAHAATIELGYVCLPRDCEETAIKRAAWPQDHIDNAVELARDVVRRIRRGEFPINQDFDNAFDEFARICQTTMYRAEAEDGPNEGGAE